MERENNCWRADMRNQVTKWLVEYIKNQQISIVQIQKVLGISMEKLYPDTKKHLNADEFLKLCAYLHIDPQKIPLGNNGEEVKKDGKPIH